MTYPALPPYIAPAREAAEIWRTLLGLVLIFALYTGGAIAVVTFGGIVLGKAGLVTIADISEGRTPAGLLLLLFHFIAMAGAVALVTRLLHKRSVGTLFGPARLMWRDFGRMAGLAAILAIIGASVVALTAPVSWDMKIGTWLIFLPLALPLILLQTGAEEMLFRAYFMQQLGARFGVAARAVWMLLPALIFGTLHMDPASQGANVWAVLAVTVLFGAIAADITARSGNLGAAWGMHFVNNVQAMLLISLAGPLSGLSLGTIGLATSAPAVLPYFALDGAAMIVLWLIWRRRYG